MESLLVSLLIFAIVVTLASFIIKRVIPEPYKNVAWIILAIGVGLWLIFNVRAIVGAIAHCCQA